MTNFIEPLMQQSTPSIIADKLRHAIGHGELKPGAQLSEAELARKFGVSRGPLREGMQRLTQEGLLVSIRHRGLFVIEMPGTCRAKQLNAPPRAGSSKAITSRSATRCLKSSSR